ncbi:MAG: SAM-dependent methyltransferase [Clostridiales bacterium]|jgi:putative AdoMet-dependent methyltransferase|nr:SAM-dependent methyltransferase [Clostridiales bacterium]
MMNSKGFDNWAGEYDESIAKSKGYPFEGYYNVLAYVHNMIQINNDTKILDIGVGTGQLTYELYKKGGHVYGIDFSEKMLEFARERMPGAIFYKFNFNNGIPEEIKDLKFDYIVSSYAIHHIDDKQKLNFIKELKSILKYNGIIVLADVAFKTRDALKKCKEKVGNGWDNDEIYMIANEMESELRREGFLTDYVQMSSCAGILKIKLGA